MDHRSHTVAFVAHCLLNQNAKVQGLAQSPAMVDAVVEVLRACRVGLVQMPCPECRCFGLGRPTGEDTVEQYDLPEYRAICAALAGHIASDMERYLRHGYRIPFVLGVEGSPSCSVQRIPTRSGLVPGEGLFIRALRRALADAGLDVAVLGVPETGDLRQALAEIRRRVAAP